MAAVLAAQAGTTLELIDTPVVTIDLDVMDQNIARLQSYLSLHGLRNRPHVKTHKIPSIARMQVAAGAAGITCQKAGWTTSSSLTTSWERPSWRDWSPWPIGSP